MPTEVQNCGVVRASLLFRSLPHNARKHQETQIGDQRLLELEGWVNGGPRKILPWAQWRRVPSR